MSKNRSEIIKGIVVKAFPYGDADLILKVICSPGGKLSLFAKRARKSKRRFSFGVELFDYGLFEISHGSGSMANVKNFSPQKLFMALRDDLTKLTAATTLAESFEILVNEDDSSGENLLELLISSLKSIESASEASLILRITYLCLTNLLVRIGYRDISKIQPASAQRLLTVLDEIEFHSERQLLTKTALQDVIEFTKRQIKTRNTHTPVTIST